MGQRQHAGDYPAAFCDQVIRAVTERLLDDTLPSRQVKEGSAGMREDKIIPPPLIAAPELPYRDAGLRSIQDVITGNGPPPSPRKSSSIRVQVKSPRRRRRRGSVRPRLR